MGVVPIADLGYKTGRFEQHRDRYRRAWLRMRFGCENARIWSSDRDSRAGSGVRVYGRHGGIYGEGAQSRWVTKLAFEAGCRIAAYRKGLLRTIDDQLEVQGG